MYSCKRTAHTHPSKTVDFDRKLLERGCFNFCRVIVRRLLFLATQLPLHIIAGTKWFILAVVKNGGLVYTECSITTKAWLIRVMANVEYNRLTRECTVYFVLAIPCWDGRLEGHTWRGCSDAYSSPAVRQRNSNSFTSALYQLPLFDGRYKCRRTCSATHTHLLHNRDEDLVALTKLCHHTTQCLHGNRAELRWRI